MIYDLRFKKKIKKIIGTGSLVLLLLQQGTMYTFAQSVPGAVVQQSTDSATTTNPTPTPKYSIATSSASLITDTPTPSGDNPFEDTTSPTITSSQDLLDQSLGNLPSQSSASVKQAPVVGKLVKQTYRKDEKVSIVVGNQQAGNMQVALFDGNGRKVSLGSIEETTVGSQTLVAIDPSQFAFHPGKYTLKVTDSSGNTTSQDFTWGVLAINTNKSFYLSQEDADISIAVLDDKGMQVCDAAVSLDIASPSGTFTHFSTEEKSITVNAQCGSHNMSLVPDYEVHTITGPVGDYTMTLTATTKNGTNSIDETLRVVDAVPFDVERESATRLYPANTYPMLFHITANQDFSGTLTETVPASFVVSPVSSSSAQSYTDTTLVVPTPNTEAQFGTTSLTLAMPFVGSAKMVQGFGSALTDPDEKAYYQQFGLAGHDGLDFAMPSGKKVLATDDGVVTLSGNSAYGITVVVQHAWGKSYYGHLSKSQVAAGQHVTKGEVIGLSGATGHVTGPHLHFGIKPLHPSMANGFYGKVDPTQYLAGLAANTTVLGVSTGPVGISERVIVWHVTLKKGQQSDLGYFYQVPGQSPAFFEVGPLKFSDQTNTTVFEEARQWQLAIDANSTAGPSQCTTGANVTGIGTIAWNTPGNGCTNVAANASTASTVNLSLFSNYLSLTGFGFSIPSTAKIIGIQFSINRWAAKNGTATGMDDAVRVVKGGTVDTVLADDRSSANAWPASSGTPQAYGTTTDLWGNTWTPTDINASNFGVAISARGSSSTKGVTADVSSTAGAASTQATITYNQVPNAPTQSTPSNNATNVSTNPAFTMSTTDPETDNLQYKVTIYSNSLCTSVVQTNDQTSSQTGWSGQNATCSVANDCYTSGTTSTYTTQSALSANTQYWWKASAIDPLGTNTFVNSSTCNTFTTGAATATLDELLRHGQWFNSGLIQPFTF